ncbi:Interleukin-1 alpha [Galemys pyrenaicus]|uniref:Interleukin-1 n=1 Tax=Galemys pyrenaicus TaxID=202257 RepID=A0A8J5ZYR8_GALPY|nr:Interleukin-1 alpha [Galemys pyrenaicus]
MAKVPDLFEDLKNCYSENEDYSPETDQLSLNQKSFYDAKYDALHEVCSDEFISLSTSETSNTSKLAFKKDVVVFTTKGKILKKRRLSLNQFITDGDLEAITNNTEEIIQPRSVSYNFQNNMAYRYRRTIKQEFILNNVLNESVTLVTPGQEHLKTCALQKMEDAVKFDMDAYVSNEDPENPVALRISGTRLFVSAQSEGEPILLKEISRTTKTISDTKLLFLWDMYGTKSYFKSVANPNLFLATKQGDLVHMAHGEPSGIDFLIIETQS